MMLWPDDEDDYDEGHDHHDHTDDVDYDYYSHDGDYDENEDSVIWRWQVMWKSGEGGWREVCFTK